MNDDLMTLDDIAVMAECSLRHARDVLVKLEGFPSESPISTPRKRRWVRAEVRAFVHRGADNVPELPSFGNTHKTTHRLGLQRGY